MRVVRRALGRHGVSSRREQRIDVGPLLSLRESKYRFAIFAECPTVSARPRTFRQGDRVIRQREGATFE